MIAGTVSDRERSQDEVGVADTMTSGEHPVSKVPASLPIDSERYQLLELLGRGGMGEVHKAFDPRLGRHVALKIMREASPEQAARLVTEARAQARVEHANVCKVYGVGELGALPFIALQYIDGKTLQELAPQMTREERIRVMRDVADALHAAHRQGLVHRDVKPANILVERTEGGWHPYVTDFGVAREIDAPSVTKTGVATGTPLYMAPEQAKGQTARIDRRTDVYGLGATLYNLLSGRHPFEGDTAVDVIFKLTNDDATPLRLLDPAIPVDLETITMKCLEKDPARRYDSARALADDLKAWVDGEPILARRTSLGYRVAKRARKHLALVSTAAVVLVAALVLTGYAIHAKRAAAEQAQLAHAFGQEVERNDAIARYAALLPLHDTRRERTIIAARMAALESRIAALGGVAEGPGRYALGRGYLVLERPVEARRELERAWQAGYRTPEVSYALGLALGQLYQRALSSVAPGDDREASIARRGELAKTLRDPALAYLKSAGTLDIEAPAYVEGLIALHERRWEQALDKARLAQGQVPWMYEAHTLEGDIRLTRASERWSDGGPDEALAELDRAGRAYRAAAELARSSERALAGDCRRLVLSAEILAESDRSPAGAVNGAVDACGHALQALPGDGAIYADLIDVYRRHGRFLAQHNGDPTGPWIDAARIGAQAEAADPDDPRMLIALGNLEKERASHDLDNGGDPRPRVARAIAAATSVVARDPNATDAFHLESDALLVQGDWEASHGLDPRAAYDRAAAAGERAFALSPQGWKTLNAIGLGWLSKGMWEVGSGLDPTPDLERAAVIYQKVVKANPNVDYGYNNLCVTWQTEAEYQIKRGLDPTATLDKALVDCKRTLAVDPGGAATQHSMGCTHLDVAIWQRERGVDPTAELELARASFATSLAIDRRFELAHLSLGQSELVAARWAVDHGASPTARFEAARAALERALGVNAQNADTLARLAELHRIRADWAAAAHRSVDAEVRAGLERTRQALAVNARHALAPLQAGALQLIAARAHDGASRRDSASQARASLEQALRADGNLEREVRPLVDEATRLSR
ncbi:MAG: Protein kinase [Myxococcales bacterium]|nr:Protein kinase [Myxococcales bacterium]